MTSLPLMYSTAILDQVNLFLRSLMRILRFLRTLMRILRKKKETVVPPILLAATLTRPQCCTTLERQHMDENADDVIRP